MEFLKACNTNAQAIGNFEAIAYEAVSISRITAASSTGRDWVPSDDIRLVESELRNASWLVSPDASRPWLWLFKPATTEKSGLTGADWPQIDGYHLHTELAGFLKASELARPPQRMANAAIALGPINPLPAGSSNKGSQSGGARPAPGHNQANAHDQQQQPVDCFALYELFTSSVIALISYSLVKHCDIVALNFRTFLSRSPRQHDASDLSDDLARIHWLTGVSVQWTSSGTLLLSATTEPCSHVQRIDEISSSLDQKQLIGACIRMAPSGILARVVSFDDPLESFPEVLDQRQRKRARIASLEQGIVKWKAAVRRWLGWKGYDLADLHKKEAWLRIRVSQPCVSVASNSYSSMFDRDTLWPRAMCIYLPDVAKSLVAQDAMVDSSREEWFLKFQKWFETPKSNGFKDPLDIAQEWALGKAERDRAIEIQRKAKKTEEDAMRRKEEQSGLFPSSPLNARGGIYGDLPAVGGVYPTPPDGIPPGTAVSCSDTPSVSGTTSNIVLAPGGGPNPAINLSAPQDSFQGDVQQSQPSPAFHQSMDNTSNAPGNDDLFGDMEDDGYEANDIGEADFDFFDTQDENDVDMLDAPTPPGTKVPLAVDNNVSVLTSVTEPEIKEEMPDPFAALENALATASQPIEESPSAIQVAHLRSAPRDSDLVHRRSSKVKSQLEVQMQSIIKEPTPPLSPTKVAQALQPSPTNKKRSQIRENPTSSAKRRSSFDPLHFNRRMSLADAKYQGGRFSANHDNEKRDEGGCSASPPAARNMRNVPLMIKLRDAIGAASAINSLEISSLARADSDQSDTYSETSEGSVEDHEGGAGVSPAATMTTLVLPVKRKLPTEGNRTPMSVASFAESLALDNYDLHGLQLDDNCLSLLESSPWDWIMTSTISPSERPMAASRFDMPVLPPPVSQLPDTPTSQPDLSWESIDEKASSTKDRIAITQIVTDQIVLATLDLLGEDEATFFRPGRRSSLDAYWHSTIKHIFPNVMDCDLNTLAAVHEVFPDLSQHTKGSQRPPPQRQSNDSPALTRSHMYPIHAPYLRVRRAETHWDLLPPAIAFWEPLGLSPVSPAKNVVSFCVYPHNESVRSCLETFMLNVQLAYDSCKFGTHSRVETVVEFEGGLVPWKAETALNPKDTFVHLRETCVQLGKLLAIQYAKIREQQDTRVDAFVIYMIDPAEGFSGLWEMCSAFWALFQAYGQSPPGRHDQSQKPDLVLQVVPMKCIASAEAPVILDPSTYLSLAREVYDRCPPSAPSEDRTALGIYAAPSFQLEESLPRNIPFKLISEPPQDLIRENSYLHVGYAMSLDGTWLTAAWTDNCGKSQAVVSYHLGTRVFGEIAQEIWQTTVEIAQARRVQWRICVARAGAMEKEELETWSQIITRPTTINLFITLLTVDTDPPLKLTPCNILSTATGTLNTPSSTPQPGLSPDTSAGLTPAATPSADSGTDPSMDPEARLVDITDETWGVILAHRLHNSNSTNIFNPAVVSGLLIKRGTTFGTSSSTTHLTPDPESGPVVIAVNILWIGAVGSTRAATSPFPPPESSTPPTPGGSQEGPRTSTSLNWTPTPQSRTTAESLLKEALGQYRALGLLAKLRGMRGTKGGSIPWHIAAALRGAKGVGKVVGGLPL